MIEMYEQGYPINTIARLNGLTRSTVMYYIYRRTDGPKVHGRARRLTMDIVRETMIECWYAAHKNT